jgi:hypothetical protein
MAAAHGAPLSLLKVSQPTLASKPVSASLQTQGPEMVRHKYKMIPNTAAAPWDLMNAVSNRASGQKNL